jgi:hypothetical protein
VTGGMAVPGLLKADRWWLWQGASHVGTGWTEKTAGGIACITSAVACSCLLKGGSLNVYLSGKGVVLALGCLLMVLKKSDHESSLTLVVGRLL